MSLAELPCYTIINVPSDFETPNEIQLKNDLEKGDIKVKKIRSDQTKHKYRTFSTNI